MCTRWGYVRGWGEARRWRLASWVERWGCLETGPRPWRCPWVFSNHPPRTGPEEEGCGRSWGATGHVMAGWEARRPRAGPSSSGGPGHITALPWPAPPPAKWGLAPGLCTSQAAMLCGGRAGGLKEEMGPSGGSGV